ncbi:MAG: polysaccharide lyase beta-sandwich domain-containing protein [Opitutaceae bacterium]|jgi:chondroitin AC lyase|nr:polysaccharide lyase beta-sandwich domain-containing protein [Opitutaceae bacterium]
MFPPPSLRFFVLFLSLAAGVFGAWQNDLDAVRARLEEDWLARVDIDAARTQLAALREDGAWPDLDYANREGTNWPQLIHAERATLLAKAWRAPDSPLARDPALRAAIGRAWEFWFARDFTNHNWWYNEIGVPRALAPGLLLLRDELTPREREQGLRILARAKIQAESQNLVWLAEINALRGLIAGDADLVARAYGRIAQEIRVVAPGAEGVQADMSLLQHRRCLYNHGYGASFAVDATRLARLLSGTRFALPPERIALLESFLLDGSQWMGLGPWQDWGARGREIARVGRGLGTYQAVAAETLLALAPLPARAEELRALAARVRETPDAPALVGARHFWRADFTAFHRPGFYASVRSFSSRLANTDFNGPENLFAHHLADGATALMTRGGEYAAVFPFWNWQRIPGTTSRQAPLLKPATARRENGSRAFAGAATDGRSAMVAFDFERDGLSARKAWFLSDAGLVALGAGISDPENQPVVTTLNQALLRGALTVAPDSTWLHHDGLLYATLDGTALRHESDERESSWRAIHQNLSDAPIRAELFTAWLDHGAGPRDAAYAYLIAPASTTNADQITSRRESVRILANSSEVQAVAHAASRTAGVVFYAPGELEFGRFGRLSVDAACAVLLTWDDSGSISVTVADPAQSAAALRLRLGAARAEFILPDGQQAGASVTRVLNP